MMSNIVDDFSVSMWYTYIMKEYIKSLMGAISWGFFYAKRFCIHFSTKPLSLPK